MNQLDKEITKLETLIDLIQKLLNTKFNTIKTFDNWKVKIVKERYTFESLAKLMNVSSTYLQNLYKWFYASEEQLDKYINEFKKL